MKIKTKRIIPKILYKLVKNYIYFCCDNKIIIIIITIIKLNINNFYNFTIFNFHL